MIFFKVFLREKHFLNLSLIFLMKQIFEKTLVIDPWKFDI